MVRGQIKIQQMAFMLIAVTLFFALAGLFFLAFTLSDLRGDVEGQREEGAAQLVSKLANSPEFSCGGAFGTERTNCVDADKVMALKNHEEAYDGFWGNTNIEIRTIYPEKEEVECERGNFPSCNVIKVTESGEEGVYQSNFVSLCRKEEINGETETQCDLAKLLVSYQ